MDKPTPKLRLPIAGTRFRLKSSHKRGEQKEESVVKSFKRKDVKSTKPKSVNLVRDRDKKRNKKGRKT